MTHGTSCPNCHRPAICLITLTSPRGPYQICVACLGKDAEQRVTAPTAFAAPAPRTAKSTLTTPRTTLGR